MNSGLIFWHNTILRKEQRQKINGHKSFVLWFTGLPSSGKSTISNMLEYELNKSGMRTYLLDGDNIRKGLNSDLEFSPKSRKENIRRIAELSKLFIDAGIIVIAASISPYKADRELARKLMENDEFIEIYLKCPLYVCEKRDPKGLYRKARAGRLPEFTGITAPYEEPNNSEIIIESDKVTVGQAVQKIIDYLRKISTPEIELPYILKK